MGCFLYWVTHCQRAKWDPAAARVDEIWLEGAFRNTFIALFHYRNYPRNLWWNSGTNEGLNFIPGLLLLRPKKLEIVLWVVFEALHESQDCHNSCTMFIHTIGKHRLPVISIIGLWIGMSFIKMLCSRLWASETKPFICQLFQCIHVLSRKVMKTLSTQSLLCWQVSHLSGSFSPLFCLCMSPFHYPCIVPERLA